ncbi:hypothetical protein J2S43_008087 [Catenuloplanes nepalensis]|uniref:Uncharacterized protein n=1 Tax=Catenuloplanes nepalensis TaxID=587533 RepID=A0ABT9N7T4_9ACTN|nr:hypothetical protein [Catenuloplanes nepalensis]MDP9799575.1 hypothetical protein [Catenuloplanes nepalensis]
MGAKTALLAFSDGDLRRSPALSPDDGIVEDIGEPYGFEAEFWAGARPDG